MKWKGILESANMVPLSRLFHFEPESRIVITCGMIFAAKFVVPRSLGCRPPIKPFFAARVPSILFHRLAASSYCPPAPLWEFVTT